jgi:hypothetical protein
MRCLFAIAFAAVLLVAVPARADTVNNLSIGALPNPVPQSLSNPCIICGTTAPGQPANFGYNNFSNTGSDTSFNTFSTDILGGGPLLGNLEANALPYSGALLDAFLQGAGDVSLKFGVAIDVNTAHNGETLEQFQLIDLSLPAGQRVIFDIDGPIALPDINNGNGKGDYLITGFDLSNVSAGDLLLFHASWSGASDGAESFYIVPLLATDTTPIHGAAWLFVSGLGVLTMLGRRRQRTPIAGRT